MKELFTKNFWKDVKTTYEEAQKDPPAPALEKKEADCQSANALPTLAPAGCQPAPPGTTE